MHRCAAIRECDCSRRGIRPAAPRFHSRLILAQDRPDQPFVRWIPHRSELLWRETRQLRGNDFATSHTARIDERHIRKAVRHVGVQFSKRFDHARREQTPGPRTARVNKRRSTGWKVILIIRSIDGDGRDVCSRHAQFSGVASLLSCATQARKYEPDQHQDNAYDNNQLDDCETASRWQAPQHRMRSLQSRGRAVKWCRVWHVMRMAPRSVDARQRKPASSRLAPAQETESLNKPLTEPQ